MRAKMFALLIALSFLLTGCGKNEAVLNVEEQISSIGTVSLQSLENIEKAEAAYAALSSKDKEDVSNYELLEEARAEYDTLVEQRNEEQVSAVEILIEPLSNITLESKSDIEEARRAYDELDTSLQTQVSNAQVLFDAEERIVSLVLEEVSTTDFKSISCRRANVFEDVSFNTWFDDDEASATLALLFQLEGDEGGWLDASIPSVFGGIICQNKVERRYDLLLNAGNNGICHIQYWPESKKAQMATKMLSINTSEYAELLKEAGIVENYKKISWEAYGNVLDAAIDAVS